MGLCISDIKTERKETNLQKQGIFYVRESIHVVFFLTTIGATSKGV
jgi:DNA-binding transcriptional regulator WhiA